jgi:hypothetical protein
MGNAWLYKEIGFRNRRNTGNDIQNLIVASATARRAVGYVLYVLECVKQVVKMLVRVKRIGNICVADLLAVTYRIVLFHIISSSLMGFIAN